MRRVLIATCATLVVAGSAEAAKNRLTGIQVQEGPNNTVITIEGSSTPTFTVFKLLDPVRLLVDVADAALDTTRLAGSITVRNGVVHDIETVQFASQGRTVARVVVGFDKEAPYRVKADGAKIRIVIDGADRKLPELDSKAAKEAVEQARRAIEAEGALRLKLKAANERAETLDQGRIAAEAARSRLARDLEAARGEVDRLKKLVEAAGAKRLESDDLTRESERRALDRKNALEEAARVAQERVDALALERKRLEAERDAVAKAVDAAKKRSAALQKVLTLEESRRRAAERARTEEEALVRSARAAREAEEKKARAAREARDAEERRATSLAAARSETEAVRKQADAAKKEIDKLQAALDEARKESKGGTDARVRSLTAELERVRTRHERELATLQASLKRAETDASNKERAYQAALGTLKVSQRELQRELEVKRLALARQQKAVAKAEKLAGARKAALDRLAEREQERIAAERTVEALRKARIAAQAAVKTLERRKAELEATVAGLTSDKATLEAALKAARSGADTATLLQKSLAARRQEMTRLKGQLSALSRENDTAGKELQQLRAQIATTRLRLAREKEDLAAALRQKEAYKGEIAGLRARAAAERKALAKVSRDADAERKALAKVSRDADAERKALAKVSRDADSKRKALAKVSRDADEQRKALARLTEQRKAEAARVAELRAHVEQLERAVTSAGDAETLGRMLRDRKAEIAALRRELAQRSKVGNAEDRAAQKRLDAALARARTEARKSAEGRARLAKLKKFLESQKKQLARLKGSAGEQKERLAAREREVSELKRQLASVQSGRVKSVNLKSIESRTLRAALAAERKTAAEAAARLAEARAELRDRKARLAQLEAAVAAERGRADAAEHRLGSEKKLTAALNQKLRAAQAEIAELVEKQRGYARQIAGLERDLARGAAADAGAIKARLQQARAQLQKLTRRLAKETSRREAEARDADRRIAELAREKAELEGVLAGMRTGATRKGDKALARALELKSAQVRGLEQKLIEARAARDAAVTLRHQLDAARTEIAALKKVGAARDARLAAAERRLQSLSEEKRAADVRVARLEKALATARSAGRDTAGAEQRLAAARAETRRLEAALTRAAKVGAARDARLAAAERRLASLSKEKKAADIRVARLEKALAATRSAGGDTAGVEQRLATARAETRRLEAALAELRRDGAARDARLAAAERQLQSLSEEKKAADKTVARLEKALADARSSGGDTRGAEQRLAAAKAETRRLEAALARARAGEKAASTELARLKQEKRRLEATVAQLRSSPGGGNGSDRARLVKALRDKERRIARLQGQLRTARAPAPPRGPMARVTNVSFRERDNVSQIEIDLDGDAGYEVIEKTDRRMVLVIDKARIPKVLERRLDTSDFYGPIKMVSTYADPNAEGKVRIVVELNAAVRNQLRREGNRLVWDFHNRQRLDRERVLAGGGDRVRYEPTMVGGDRVGAPPAGGGGSVIPGGGTDFGVLNPFPNRGRRRRYSGTKINLTIKDADIRQVLTFLAKEGGVNIIASEGVSGLVTVHLKEVPWDLALDMILKSKGLDYIVEEGVYRVAPVDVIQKEFELELEKRKKLTELKKLVVKLVTVNYAEAEKLQPRVKDILSPKGTVSVDKRTNTVIIKDIEEHVLAAEDLIRRLDTQTPQVLIEARIVEASTNFSEEVGIQWGGNYTASPVFGNETGLVFPAILGLAGAADDATSPTSGLLNGTNPRFAVNLPAAVGSGKGGGIGLTLGTLSGAGSISLRLTAAEERGTVKIISSPRIATLDNTSAEIQQGISIPISVVSALGVNTQFFNANLKLKVRPHVTQDGNIAMELEITKNEPNFAQRGANGNPTIESKEAKTNLLVRDGDTAVIGGIYTRNRSRSYSKVPVLGDIPFLGWLFKSRIQADKRTELILFITPRIINRAASRVRVD